MQKLLLAAVAALVIAPFGSASATDGRTAVGMCIDSTASGARCAWSVNDKGEILDPWGTPIQFYFSHNEVMIRSAGPNKAWEDSSNPTADDLYRCAAIEKK